MINEQIKQQIISDLVTDLIMALLQQKAPMDTPVTGTDITLQQACDLAGFTAADIAELQQTPTD